MANDSHRGKKRPRTNTGSDDDEVRRTMGREKEGGRRQEGRRG